MVDCEFRFVLSDRWNDAVGNSSCLFLRMFDFGAGMGSSVIIVECDDKTSKP